jgi:dTDP-4-dehydrorhamnose reductase
VRIAVTGKTGQIVTSLIERAGNGPHQIFALGRPELDLADLASIEPTIRAARPDAVVSAAAYTAVDTAESERDLAFAINAAGAAEVARVAHELLIPVIHISTDYVFDGSNAAPYVESDPVAPRCVYGESKLKAEAVVLASHPGAVICRTSWVYSPFGANFVKTMLRLAGTREELSVVADQIGNPTSALDIADGVLVLVEALVEHPLEAPRGIFHMAGSGECSWADLAEAVFAASAANGGPSAKVNRIETKDYPTPASRPANSRLSCDKLARAYGVYLPDWRQSVAQVVARLIKQMGSVA